MWSHGNQTTQSQVMMDPWGNKGNKNIPGFKWKWSYKLPKPREYYEDSHEY